MMYSSLKLLQKYLHYYFAAENSKGHGIHSPFVFDFVRNVLNDRSKYEAYHKVENLRNELLQDQSLVEVVDLGAGSALSKKRQRTVADITRHAAKSRKYGQLLHRIIRYYDVQSVIELGTSLGLSTSYLALANDRVSVVTLEGAPGVAARAEQNFRQLSLKNIRLVTGNFNETLPLVLNSLATVNCCFIDGNHRKDPTLDYFNMLSEKINANSILIFDDIHWSKEMEEAWDLIRKHPSVSLSIDLFFLGFLFFRDEFKSKQHFVIRY
jgi:predicted O-methyltransferase YrrM